MLAAKVGLKLSEHAKHVQKSLASAVFVSIGWCSARKVAPRPLSVRTMS